MSDAPRIGIFGGTFDPPHIGHLILASEAASQLNLGVVLWVLTKNPPHKLRQHITPVEIRLEMVHTAISEDPRFKLSRVDVDRPPPHFAVDTLRILQASELNANLVFLMGGDSLHDLPTWHDPVDIIKLSSSIGVMRRPGDAIDLEMLERGLPGICSKIEWVDTPLIDISSSFIREKVYSKNSYRYYVTPAVAELIEKYHLYQDTNGSDLGKS